MLIELSIVPLGCEGRWRDQLAEALKLVDASGLPYLLTPSGTCIEGEWDEVMALARRCHDLARRSSPPLPPPLGPRAGRPPAAVPPTGWGGRRVAATSCPATSRRSRRGSAARSASWTRGARA